MREIEFINNEYYHIYDRGVDKRSIFFDEFDHALFCEYLYLFNDENFYHSGDPIDKVVKLNAPELYGGERDPLVEIISYNLLNNHFHFFIKQLKDGGISKLLHKIKKAYSWKFNKRQKRVGTLFEGRFKAKHIDNEAYFKHIIRYIHLNSLDSTKHGWRGGDVKDWDDALKVLNQHKWSSHNAYMGKQQDLPIILPETISSFYSSPEEYVQSLKEWSLRESDQDVLF